MLDSLSPSHPSRHKRPAPRPWHILFQHTPWHTRSALFDQQFRLLSLRLDDCDRQLIEGALVLGRVQNIAQGLGAAYIDIGDQSAAIVKLASIPEEAQPLHEGQLLPFRVARGADRVAHKGARLDGRVALTPALSETAKSATKPCLLQLAPSALQRSLMDAGDHPVTCYVTNTEDADLAAQLLEPHQIEPLNDDPHNLTETLVDGLDDMTDIDFPIPGGGRLTVEVTKALTAIDIDSGVRSGLDSHRAIVATNLRAADEIVRLVNLLDIGGNIMVDFITLPNRAMRNRVKERLEAGFARFDLRKVTVLPLSAYGLCELNRERGGAFMPALLAQPSYQAGRLLLKLWKYRFQRNEDMPLTCTQAVAEVLIKRLPPEAAVEQLGFSYTLTIVES